MKVIAQQEQQKTGLNAWQHSAVFLLAYALLISRRPDAVFHVSTFLLCIMCVTVALQWRYPAFKDLHFGEYASKFEAAPSGTAVTIPENPEGWSLRLVKLPSNR